MQQAMSSAVKAAGLEGIVAGDTAISNITGELRYRGYAVNDLASRSSFTEVAYLLLHGELPTMEQLADFKAILAESAEVAPDILAFVQTIPLHVSAMDVLRTGISALAHFDPQLDDNSHAANIAKGTRLLAQIPILIAARHRQRLGLPLVQPDFQLNFAAGLLHLINGEEPISAAERAMDVSLILYAEHEFNASTFTARVVMSTMSDLHSAVVAAVGALKGPLHGGANERVLEVLQEVGSPARAEAWVREALVKKRRIMGFGHRVYKDGDPRAVLLAGYCKQLADQIGDHSLEQIADTIERIVGEEKGIPPNLDWPSARLYHYLGLPVDLYTPLFVASRVAGWTAHAIEQADNNRLIRPRSEYVGPAPRKFVPIDDRT